jgi:hypothetical protein
MVGMPTRKANSVAAGRSVGQQASRGLAAGCVPRKYRGEHLAGADQRPQVTAPPGAPHALDQQMRCRHDQRQRDRQHHSGSDS